MQWPSLWNGEEQAHYFRTPPPPPQSLRNLLSSVRAALDTAPEDMEQARPLTPSSQAIAFVPRNDNMDYQAIAQGPMHQRKKFVLCFDGTGNKFSGTDADSNILKIYRMLDRNGDDQYHYYQPGIGTYVTKAGGSMSRTSRIERFKSWYAKAKDSAVGKFLVALAAIVN